MELPELKIAAIGDSVAYGVGVRSESYPVLVARRFGARLIDLTGTGLHIDGAFSLREQARDADIALIALGQTEAMVRPTDRSLRFFPRRWRQPGWMDPRPYYSRRRRKRIGQMIESAVRWRVKVTLIRLTGGMRWIEPDAYGRRLAELVDYLQDSGVSKIAIIGRLGHDERYFPRSTVSVEEYMAASREVAEAKNVHFFDAVGICRQWEDYLLDHAHPNASGHRRIAERLIESLNEHFDVENLAPRRGADTTPSSVHERV